MAFLARYKSRMTNLMIFSDHDVCLRILVIQMEKVVVVRHEDEQYAFKVAV